MPAGDASSVDAAVGADRTPSLLLIFAVTVTGITTNTLITASIPDILDGLGASAGAAGLIISAATLPGVVLAPVIGVLADRYGRREVLTPCLLAFAAAGGLGALAPNLATLAALRFVQGAGSAGLVNLAVVIIGDHWEGDERATLIGRNSAVLTVALAVFPFAGGALTDLGSWRTPFLVYPVAVVTAAAVWRGLPAGRTRDISVGDQLRELGPILRRPRVVALNLATVVLFALIFGAILTILPVYASREFGLGASFRGVLLGAPAVGSTAASVSLGWLLRRLGRRRLLTIAGLTMAGGLVGLGLAGSLVGLGIGVLLFGLAEGAAIPTLQYLASDAGDDDTRGSVVAAQVGVARIGQTVGPIGLGALFGAAGPRTAYLVGAGIAVTALTPAYRWATHERHAT